MNYFFIDAKLTKFIILMMEYAIIFICKILVRKI